MKFIFPPTELILYTYAARGRQWSDAIAKSVHSAVLDKKIKPLALNRTKLTGKELSYCLRSPEPPVAGEEDQDSVYRSWYQKVTADPAKEVRGYILPNVRAIFFVFTSDMFDEASVVFWPHGKHKGKADAVEVADKVVGDESQASGEGKKSRFWLTCYQGDAKQLTSGIYSIEVTLGENKVTDHTRSNKEFSNSKTLVFKTHVTFDTTNAAGSFAIVQCDPVSVEEAMMVQFPKELAHLLEAARRSNMERERLGGDLPKTFKQQIPQGLKPWSERLEVSKTVLSQASSLIGADSRTGLFKAVGKVLWNALGNKGNEHARAVVDLVFGVDGARDAWKAIQAQVHQNLVNAVKAKKMPGVVSEALLTDMFKVFHKKDFKGIAPARLSKDLVQSHAKWKMKYLETKQNKVLDACARRRWAKKLGKIAKMVDYPLTAYALFDGVSTVCRTATSARIANANFEKLCKAYVEQICETNASGQGRDANACTFYPCREAACNLEKMRGQALILELKLDEDVRKAIFALHDAVLLGLTLIPATAPIAGIALVVEGGAKLVWDFGKTVGACADQLMFDNAMTQFLAQREVFADLADYYGVNARRMAIKGLKREEADRPENHVQIQYRLRAEVIYGLFWLIAYCAVGVDEKNSLESNLEKYKVHQYIRNYVLNDGWAFSLFPYIPRRMHKIWLQMIKNGEKMHPVELEQMGLDHDYLLLDKPSQDRQGIQTIYGGFLDGSMVTDFKAHKLLRPAAFQACFPIQMMDSAAVADFAGAFKTIHKELDADCIAYSEIFYRERGAPEDSPWLPVMDVILGRNGAPESLSPYHQIRVLIVLKKHSSSAAPIKGIYPVQLSLRRTDGIDISKGPKYEGLTRILTRADRPDAGSQAAGGHDPDAKAGWPWEGHCGCIIDPFFNLYGVHIPGTKPMAGKLAMGIAQGGLLGKRKSDVEAAEDYYHSGHLTNMRYGFQMQIGNNAKTRQWVRVQSRWEQPPPDDAYFLGIGPADTAWPEDPRIDYPVSVDCKRRYHFDQDGFFTAEAAKAADRLADDNKLLSKHLLTSRTATSTYPPLLVSAAFDPFPEPFAVPLMRLGNGDYLAPLEVFEPDLARVSAPNRLQPSKPTSCRLKSIGKTVLAVNHFDWCTPVSFIILLAVKQIDPSAYLANGLDWRNLPFDITLVELTGFNTTGARLSSRLHYLGAAHALNGQCVLGRQDKIQWECFNKLKPIRKLLQNPIRLTALLQPMSAMISELALPDTRFHLYAAYLKMSYDAPSGAVVESIRPFGAKRVDADKPRRRDAGGRGLEEAPYKFALRNLRTVDDSGAALKYLRRRGTPAGTDEFEFHFSGIPAGWAYDHPHLPWMQPPQAPKKAKEVKLAEIKTWIEEKPDFLKLIG